MDQKKLSETLEEISDFKTENPALQDSLSYLKSIVGSEFKILRWTKHRIAIPLKLSIDLPSIGNYEGIDIRPEEDVLFVFDVNKYPTDAPMVFTDRLDFPKDKLAHLYIATEGRTPAFCYVRGSMDQWYANKTIRDLLVRISNWLRDAATGELTENGDQFEPLRLEKYSGIVVYDYHVFAEAVLKNQRLAPGLNFALALFERIKDQDIVSFRFLKFATDKTFKDVFTEFDEEKKKDKDAAGKRILHYGYLLWSDTDETYAEYNIALPRTWSQFKAYCNGYGISCDVFEDFVATLDQNDYVSFPVVVGIRRTKHLIGYSSNVEFANFRFRVDTPDTGDGKFVNDFPISFQAHNQPATLKLAQTISQTQPSEGIKMIYGCGALGSKIGLHFGRSGNHPLVFSDPDTISSHNLVRHGLLAGQVGLNKGLALANEIKAMFPTEKTLVAGGESFPDFYTAEKFNAVSWIYDFTAAGAFFNQLVSARNIYNVGVASSNISDFGNVGITLIEGGQRNPRLDDLQVSLYALHNSDHKIKDWLHREMVNAKNDPLLVNVGVGCNSETTILSDVKVSAHAAFAAGVLEREMHSRRRFGQIFLNWIAETPSFGIQTSHFEVKPFTVFNAVNDPSWCVRFADGIIEKMQTAMRKAKKKETGGVFIGVANYKTKTIHVTGLVDAPPDSKSNSVCFYRGIKGLPASIEKISQDTGQQLGYIGEWHSHPHGPDGLSTVDLSSVARFKAEFTQLTAPLPVFLTVITPNGVLPFVF